MSSRHTCVLRSSLSTPPPPPPPPQPPPPALRLSSAPVVVNVSSAAAAMYRPQQTIYGLAKAALEHMTMNMAAELAPDRISVACARPGPVRTEFHLAAEDPEERIRLLGTLVPLGRIGEPADIARW